MRKREPLRRAWLTHGRRAMRHLLALVTCLATLTGCASRPTQPAVDCPEPPQIPASLKESALPDAQALSSEAQNWLNEASSFLSGLR